ncbi:TIGR00730 family Rossman fold protein [Pseudidiomarina sp. WS423]|uniref:LOG family protein n=1 Tax=Pseudidiomarina sp. WS423 TaxID=3425124 RepID=UPI003D6E630D
MTKLSTICVYCGSNPGFSPVYTDATIELADTLVEQGIRLVYGGAKVGQMGQLADRVLAQGGEVIGIMPQALVDKEVAHHGLTQLHVVTSMHERKAMMAELADGFIAMPGGMGTLEEIFEVVTWAQLGFHQKPCALLNVDGYFTALLTFLDNTVSQGFVKDVHRQLLLNDSNAPDLIAQMHAYEAPTVTKWLTKSEL